MVWQKNGTPTTLGGTAGVLTISDLTAKKFNVFLCHTILSSGNATDLLTTDNNTATDYAWRYSLDGGADSTVTSDTDIQLDVASLADNFHISYGLNISGEEKLFIMFVESQGVAGAGSAPSRGEVVGKVDITTNSGQFTRIDITNGHGTPTNYNIGSNLSALGTDGGETNYSIQDGAVFHEVDTNKMYQYDSATDAWTLIT